MSYALLAFLILLVLAFGYMMWKSADTWRWFHITAASLLLLLGILFLFPTAITLRSRAAWHKEKETLEAQLQRLQAEQVSLKYGDPVNGVGALELQEQLNRFSLQAGRRWQNLRNQGATQTGVTLVRQAPQAQLPPGMEADEPPADAAPAAAPAGGGPLIPQGMVVYGFAETPLQGAPGPVPTFFLGEFRVTASTPTQVTLEATGRLEDRQRQAISSGQAANWSLYELLPLDGHDLFVAPGSEPTDDALFGRVDEQLVQQMLGQGASAETISEYLRDGTRAMPDDPPMSRWIKVEFTRPHAIVVDSPEQREALDGGFFNTGGQAVDSRLRRGEDGSVRFRSGDQVIVKEEAANELIDQGVARLVDTYFIRPLNDYQFSLRRIRLRIDELVLRQQTLEFEHQVLQDAYNATVEMLAVNQDAKLKLEKDLAQLQAEHAAIAEYTNGVKQNVAETRQLLAGLYRDNVQMRRELEAAHSEIEDALR